MARRDRVPRHKSHTHKRNKNAKLSPFQREQKREKMANQVPTAKTMGALDSIPHSQRRIFEYLQEARSRQQAKRAALRQERRENYVEVRPANERDSGSSGNENKSKKTQEAATEKSDETTSAASVASTTAAVMSTKRRRDQFNCASLNEELGASVGAALQPLSSRHGHVTAAGHTDGTCDGPRTVEEIIARKKERKHKRKQEERRVRVAAKLQEMEEELDAYTKPINGSGGKRSRNKRGNEGGGGQTESADEVRKRADLAFERKLRSMKKEEEEGVLRRAAAEAAAATARRKEGEGREGKRRREASLETGEHPNGNGEGADEAAPQRHRKRISFDPDVENRVAAADANRISKLNAKRKPQDFYELVDVVRYGERVEAPPVFEVVPNRHAAVSRLANALEREEGSHGHGSGAADERHRLLAGGGPLAERKRLARLGLAPAITQTTRADGTATRISKEDEIKALRDRVMATYQRNRRKTVMERKGVNMKHEFPRFA
ncbi:hypothetical protein JKF63_06287 [Porcisia hertigi]|uniref:Uncharacterized protein n=1 Tax=Porcisia hertigi TaxID=2761500 RepID=A0A836INJ1_9TRYP|nr:hypothetical protein JKF63_06287 [Porcisia hertigi]